MTEKREIYFGPEDNETEPSRQLTRVTDPTPEPASALDDDVRISRADALIAAEAMNWHGGSYLGSRDRWKRKRNYPKADALHFADQCQKKHDTIRDAYVRLRAALATAGEGT